MTILLEFKEKLRAVYGKYGTYILPVLKFALAFCVFSSLNNSLGFTAKLNNIFVILILSLICAITPLNTIVIFGAVLIVGHCFSLGIEVAAIALILFLVIEILYLRFMQGDSLALVLTPFAYSLGIPCAVPVGFGLLRGPVSSLSVACGVIIQYFLELLKTKAPLLQAADEKAMLNNVKVILEGIVNNRQMLIAMLACITVVLVVNTIRKLSVDYSWHIAVATGSVTYAAIMILGGMVIDEQGNVIQLVLGVLGGALISLILEFFVYNVDYSRSESFQYEDDEYYYYVKAIPKISITKSKREVKKIQRENVSPFPREEEENNEL